MVRTKQILGARYFNRDDMVACIKTTKTGDTPHDMFVDRFAVTLTSIKPPQDNAPQRGWLGDTGVHFDPDLGIFVSVAGFMTLIKRTGDSLRQLLKTRAENNATVKKHLDFQLRYEEELLELFHKEGLLS